MRKNNMKIRKYFLQNKPQLDLVFKLLTGKTKTK